MKGSVAPSPTSERTGRRGDPAARPTASIAGRSRSRRVADRRVLGDRGLPPGGTRGPHPHRRGPHRRARRRGGSRATARTSPRERRGSMRRSSSARPCAVRRDDRTADRRFFAFLGRPTTEVRIYRERFLHGKAFVFGHEAGVVRARPPHRRRTVAHSSRPRPVRAGAGGPGRRVVREPWGAAQPRTRRALRRAHRTFDPHDLLDAPRFLAGDEGAPGRGGRRPPAGGMRLASFSGWAFSGRSGSRRSAAALIADGASLARPSSPATSSARRSWTRACAPSLSRPRRSATASGRASAPASSSGSRT